jgi:uncharacterized lipoprotein YajG
MRPLKPLVLAAFALAACEATVNTSTLPSGPQAAGTTQVTWRENTPVAARVADNRACEAQALGVSPFATDQEIMAAISAISPAQRDANRDACMAARGYTISQQPVCSSQDSANRQVLIGREIDFLPPLAAIRCFVPQVGGFVMA